MKKSTAYLLSAFYEMSALSQKSKLLALVLLLITSSAQAQDTTFDKIGSDMWTNATSVYKLISVFVLLAGLFFLGKGIIEGLRGEQGAWVKIGGALLVFAVWFFAVPPLINFLSTQVKKGQLNSF